MVSFPAEPWDVRHIVDMEKMVGVPVDRANLYMQALLAVAPAPGQEGFYRLVLSGDRQLAMSVPVTSIINHQSFQDMTIELQLQPGEQIVIGTNSSCSRCVFLLLLH